MKKFVHILFLSALPSLVFGQEATSTPAPDASTGIGMDDLVLLMLVTLGLVLVLLAVAQVRLIRTEIRALQNLERKSQGLEPLPEPMTLMDWYRKKVVGLKPIEMEEDLIMEDHSYDGIREMDNGMPPWLKWMFVGTIAFAVIYMAWYQVLGYGPTQYEEYAAEMEKGNAIKDAWRKKMADAMSEENVTLSDDPKDLAEGKQLFLDNCAACHGNLGEGGAGPNLTDLYWLHGGGIKNVFRTISYGVPEKGMIPWNDQMSPGEIRNIASFVLSLEGSNPPDALEPQGDLWTGEETQNQDSSAQSVDSLAISEEPVVAQAQ